MSRSGPLCRSRLPHWLAAFVLLGGIAVARGAAALTLGQIDTFEDGTTQGWHINGLGTANPPAGTLPTNVATDGPGGAGDNYLQLTSSGTYGAGGRLVGINVSQWAGNYTALAVTGISASVRNFGPSDLSLRVFVADPGTNQAISTAAIPLASGSGWVTVLFPIAAGDLTALTGSAASALSGVSELRILHSTSAFVPAAPILVQLGIDNIAVIPEPGTGLLLGLGLLALGARPRG